MTKYIFITGASRGIGKAIATHLASKGHSLILTCRSSIEELNSLAKHLSDTYHISCICHKCDMSDYLQVQKLFDIIPRPEIIINNAGISHIGLLQDMTPEEWNQVISTNLSAAFYTSKFGIPGMLSAGSGRILNISSVWGNVGASMEVAYSASKGGLNTFTKALAKELAPSHIAVNALACGLVDTEMNAHLSAEDLNALYDEIPYGSCVSPEDVAIAAGKILEMPTYFTGQILTMDGGWT